MSLTNKTTSKTIVLGIDPGFERLGIAVISKIKGQKEELLYSECFKTKSTLPFSERIGQIGEHLEEIIKKYKPSILGIENLFFTTNQTTVMRVAETRGVIIYISGKNNLSVNEYTPLQIKMAVTGYGKADKKQVMNMIPRLIKMPTNKTSDDELDAIAVGITTIAYEKI